MGNTNIFFGDSHIAGNAGVSSTQTWPNIYCTALGKTIVNDAVAGTTMTSGLGRTTFDITQVPTYVSATHNYIFICYGTNDSNLGGTASAYASAYNTAVNAVIAKGWPSPQIVISIDYYPSADLTTLQGFVTALQAVSVSTSCSFLDLFTPIYNDASKASYVQDTLHLNSTGQAVQAALAQTNIVAPTIPVTYTSSNSILLGVINLLNS
jgi:lysophospholipase L1-like esterase